MADYIYNSKSDVWQFTVSNMGLGSVISIFGCTYGGSQSLSDPTAALSNINDAIDGVSGCEFSGIQITTARNDQGISMSFGATDVSYNGARYLNETEADALRTLVISSLTSVTDLAYQDVVISSNNRT